jgi:ArsR family transcriptional regulator, arsenate/arsenite/antimonite-responsive transcriptional repressor / arsenate reductase (thioredoxin)
VESVEDLGSNDPFKVLAHDLRWRLVRHLAHSDHRVSELVELVGEKQNLVSYHLRQLRDSGLVVERRSSRDARDVYYSADIASIERALDKSARDLHPGIQVGRRAPTHRQSTKLAPRLLFLCTGNSARSIMAEAILRQLARDQVDVRSAGSTPRGVNPMAISVLAELGIETAGLSSKPMEDIAHEPFDYVITLCDIVREHCPDFPGGPDRIHWSMADPAAVEGDRATVRKAFQSTAEELSARIPSFLIAIEADRHR